MRRWLSRSVKPKCGGPGIPKRKTLAGQSVGRIKERSDADPAMVLARRRIAVRCRIGASLDSAYFEFPGHLYLNKRAQLWNSAEVFVLVLVLVLSGAVLAIEKDGKSLAN